MTRLAAVHAVGRRIPIVLLAVVTLASGSGSAIAAECKLGKMAEFSITMANLRPLMTAKINDVDEQFVVDSGAFFSMISGASAAELKLPTRPAPFGFYMTGIGGGTASVSIATAKVFTLAGVPPGLQQGGAGVLGECRFIAIFGHQD